MLDLDRKSGVLAVKVIQWPKNVRTWKINLDFLTGRSCARLQTSHGQSEFWYRIDRRHWFQSRSFRDHNWTNADASTEISLYYCRTARTLSLLSKSRSKKGYIDKPMTYM